MHEIVTLSRQFPGWNYTELMGMSARQRQNFYTISMNRPAEGSTP